MKRWSWLMFLLLIEQRAVHAQDLVSEKSSSKNLLLCSSTQSPIIICDQGDDWLVQKTSELLQKDIAAITGSNPSIQHELKSTTSLVIIIGTVKQSKFIQQFVKDKKVRIDGIQDKWEAF